LIFKKKEKKKEKKKTNGLEGLYEDMMKIAIHTCC
jgi:hypothetical protein